MAIVLKFKVVFVPWSSVKRDPSQHDNISGEWSWSVLNTRARHGKIIADVRQTCNRRKKVISSLRFFCGNQNTEVIMNDCNVFFSTDLPLSTKVDQSTLLTSITFWEGLFTFNGERLSTAAMQKNWPLCWNNSTSLTPRNLSGSDQRKSEWDKIWKIILRSRSEGVTITDVCQTSCLRGGKKVKKKLSLRWKVNQ